MPIPEKNLVKPQLNSVNPICTQLDSYNAKEIRAVQWHNRQLPALQLEFLLFTPS
jgi:hypothetical protein